MVTQRPSKNDTSLCGQVSSLAQEEDINADCQVRREDSYVTMQASLEVWQRAARQPREKKS
jgi:hypothetical protein